MTRLEAKNLSFSYGQRSPVLRDVALSVDEGEVLFILGANGSGKTTLLDCLAGLRSPQTGHVAVGGRSIDRLTAGERAQRIGVVPQMHEPVFEYTVGDVVLMGRTPHLGLFARPGRRDREAVERALESVGLQDLRNRVYTEISGGERQLALIARGLAQGAACLLMDEPAAHLDPRHQAEIFEAVSRLSSDGFSFVITSHQPNNALLYGDRVAFLVDGQLSTGGRPSDAITEEILKAAYGMEFVLIRGASGAGAILPRVVRD